MKVLADRFPSPFEQSVNLIRVQYTM